MSRPEHLRELDLLRAVALLGVGVIHAGAWVTPAEAPPGQNLLAAVSSLSRFCVPAFVFASGFALNHVYSGRAVDARQFLRRRWLRVLLPWLCCVPLFLVLDSQHGDPSLDPRSVGEWLAYGPGHLYFLVLIAQLYLLFVVLPRDRVRLRWVTGGLLALQMALMVWRTYGPMPPGLWSWPGVFASAEEAPFWAGEFALGCLAAAEWPRLARLARYWPLALVASAAVSVLLLAEGRPLLDQWREGSGAYFWPSRLLQTVLWSGTLLWLGRRIAPPAWLTELSRHSLGVYLLHPAFLDALGPATDGLAPIIRVPLLVILSLGGAYAATRLLALTRATASVVGETPRNYLQPANVYVTVTVARQRLGDIIRSH